MENKNQKNKIKRVINPVNSLTLEPGGVTLVIEYVNGEIERRDRIKFPHAYKNKVLAQSAEEISRIYLEEVLFSSGSAKGGIEDNQHSLPINFF